MADSAPRVLVVGAGPAGIRAALAASGAGARVTLLDALPEPGGQIWRGLWKKAAPGPAGHWLGLLARSPVDLGMGRRVVAAPGPGRLGLSGPEGPAIMPYDRLVLATGARERFLPFPGWTLPGVLGAGALQALSKGGLDVEDRRVVVAGTGPLLLAVAAHLRKRGARVLRVAEQAPARALLALAPALVRRPRLAIQALGFLGLPVMPDAWVLRAEGDCRLRAVHLRTPRGVEVLEADYLACGFGLVPNLDVARLLDCAVAGGVVQVDALQRTSRPEIFAAGESTGIGGVDKALAEGAVAGLAAAGRDIEARALAGPAEAARAWGRAVEAAFAPRPELRALPEPGTLLCRCENVTVGAAGAFGRGRDARLHARCGMGLCQGRTCGPAAEFLFGWEPGGPRQPLVPTPIHDLVGLWADPEET